MCFLFLELFFFRSFFAPPHPLVSQQHQGVLGGLFLQFANIFLFHEMSNKPLQGGSTPAHEIKLCFGLESKQTTLTLKVDWSSGIGGADWPAANLFCHAVSHDDFYKSLFHGKSVIELGSGTGMGGIIVARLFEPTLVMITDLEQYVDHINHNIEQNNCSKDIVKARALNWLDLDGAFTTGEGHGQVFDVILALECVYREDLYQPLIDAIVRVSKPESLIFLGLTRLFAQQSFFQKLRRVGLTYKKIPDHALPAVLRKDSATADCGLLLLYYTQDSKVEREKSDWEL